MSQTEPKPWGAQRTHRFLQILELKTQGLTDIQVAEKMPISRATVSRELNSPQAAEIGRILRRRAEGMIWSLVEKQLKEIEGTPDLKPFHKLSFRGQLIKTLTSLVPKQVEQKITGKLQQTIEVEGIELKGLDEDAVRVIIDNFMESEARRLRQTEPSPLFSPEERHKDGLDTTRQP